MTEVSSLDLDKAIKAVLENLIGISQLYPSQYEIITSLLLHDNIFYTNSTNSGKTLPAVIYPEILKFLISLGYSFPSNPKLLFIYSPKLPETISSQQCQSSRNRLWISDKWEPGKFDDLFNLCSLHKPRNLEAARCDQVFALAQIFLRLEDRGWGSFR